LLKVNLIKNRITKTNIIVIFPFLLYIVILAFYLFVYFNGGVIYFDDGAFPIYASSFIQRSINAWNNPTFSGSPFFGTMMYLPVALYEFFISQILKLPIGLSEISILEIFGIITYLGFYKTANFLIEKSDLKLDKKYVALISAITSFFYIFNYNTLNSNYNTLNSYFFVTQLYFFFMIYFTAPLLIYVSISFYDTKKFIDYKKFLIIYIIGMLGIFYEAPTLTFWLLLILLIYAFIFTKNKIISLSKFIVIMIILAFSGIWSYFYLYISSSSAYYAAVHSTYAGHVVGLSELLGSYSYNKIINLFLLNQNNIILPNYLFYSSLFFAILMFVLIAMSLIIKSNNYYIKKILIANILFLLLLFSLAAGIINLGLVYYKGLVYISTFHLGLILTGLTYLIQPLFINLPINFVEAITILISITIFLSLKNNKKIIHIMSIALILAVSFTAGANAYYSINNHPSFPFPGLPNPPTNVFKVPNYFNNLGLYLHKNAGYNNVVILPVDNILSGAFYYNGTGEAANIDPLDDYFLGEEISEAMLSPMVSNLVYFPSNNITNFANYLALLGAKYVILNTASYPGPGAVARPWWPYPGAYPWNYTAFEYYLNKTPNLSFVKSFGPFLVYKVDSNVPLVYTSNGIPANYTPTQIFWLYSTGKLRALQISVIDNVSAPLCNNVNSSLVNSSFKTISNDIYIGHVDAKSNYYLILTQGYSNSWQIEINGSRMNIPHYLANGFANAWYMPPGNYYIEIINSYHYEYIETFLLSLAGLLVLIILYILDRIKFYRKDKRIIS